MRNLFSLAVVTWVVLGVQSAAVQSANASHPNVRFISNSSIQFEPDASDIHTLFSSSAEKSDAVFLEQKVAKKVDEKHRASKVRKKAEKRRLARHKKRMRQNRFRRTAAKRARERARKRLRRLRLRQNRHHSQRRHYRNFVSDCSQGAYDCNGFKNER